MRSDKGELSCEDGDAFELSPLAESSARRILLLLVTCGERGSRQSSARRQLRFFFPYSLTPECRSPAARPEEQDAAASPVSCRECPFTPEQTVSEYPGLPPLPTLPLEIAAASAIPRDFSYALLTRQAGAPHPLRALLSGGSVGGFGFWMWPGRAGKVSPQSERPLGRPCPSDCAHRALACQFGIPV